MRVRHCSLHNQGEGRAYVGKFEAMMRNYITMQSAEIHTQKKSDASALAVEASEKVIRMGKKHYTFRQTSFTSLLSLSLLFSSPVDYLMCEIIRKVPPQKLWECPAQRREFIEKSWRESLTCFGLFHSSLPHKQAARGSINIVIKILLSIRISLFKLIIYLIACAALFFSYFSWLFSSSFSCFYLFSSQYICFFCFTLGYFSAAQWKAQTAENETERASLRKPRDCCLKNIHKPADTCEEDQPGQRFNRYTMNKGNFEKSAELFHILWACLTVQGARRESSRAMKFPLLCDQLEQ